MNRSYASMKMGLGLLMLAGAAFGQNPDLRIRGDYRTPNNGAWAASASVGKAEFRVTSRFGHVYYGGVVRADEFRFTVALEFADISGFATEFADSPYNVHYDVYINGAFVGRALMNSTGIGNAELRYDSRHPDPPALPLPSNFPEPVGVGDVVSAFAAAATLPAIGDPNPTGTPMFSTTLEEEFARGDVNQDGHVDEDDFPFLAAHYDPFHVGGPYIGPVLGDFTGDNQTDFDDYQLFVANWDDSHDPPAEPAPVITRPGDTDADGDIDVTDLLRVLASFGSCAGSPGYDARADFQPNGCNDLDDLLVVLLNFGS